jgi:SAM-dependent methyltransferase
MIHIFRPVVARAPFHGLRQIVRFNWPFYAVAGTVVTAGLWTIHRWPLGGRAQAALYSAAGLAALWLAASLTASWIVYDRSQLMTGTWIEKALGFRPATWVNIHAGLDETTPVLRALFNGSRGRVFDIFDAAEMTERSIARARRLAPVGAAPEPVDYRRLPAEAGTIDAALLLLSAHELRTHDARVALFAEIQRVLSPDGRVVVAEHLRDWPNFMAFGPGFLHFHSRRTWTRAFLQAGFTVHQEFSITPFVCVFVLSPHRAHDARRGPRMGEIT